MSKKTKPAQIKIDVPDDKLLKHIVDAYGLVCQYRTVNKVPHEGMEKWLLRLVVEGCNALYNFHNQNLAKQQEAQQAAAKKESADENVSTKEVINESQPSENNSDNSKSADAS